MAATVYDGCVRSGALQGSTVPVGRGTGCHGRNYLTNAHSSDSPQDCHSLLFAPRNDAGDKDVEPIGLRYGVDVGIAVAEALQGSTVLLLLANATWVVRGGEKTAGKFPGGCGSCLSCIEFAVYVEAETV